jgi:excisionase family DNA binding protein
MVSPNVQVDAMTTNLPSLDEHQRYSIDEARSYLRVSRAKLYLKIQAGEIATIKDGRRTFVPGSEIARLSRA